LSGRFTDPDEWSVFGNLALIVADLRALGFGGGDDGLFFGMAFDIDKIPAEARLPDVVPVELRRVEFRVLHPGKALPVELRHNIPDPQSGRN
jgi:hypothetical protein